MPITKYEIFYVFTSENVNPIQYHGVICKSEEPSRERIKGEKREEIQVFCKSGQNRASRKVKERLDRAGAGTNKHCELPRG